MKRSWNKVILGMISIVGLIFEVIAIINSLIGKTGTKNEIIIIIGFILIFVPTLLLFWRKPK
ncbi:LPXTG cell wall anchor domain-containing protein [Dictyobacter kobayashii]|uniref:Uncharacterized protein n=1 Tax=Dictyobacter kobayashii TaxID=2014872 RepID=A0A402AKH5_9CHLR|nr:LPXTG cell wall anchor domain-containing protein [Dictyobacter kobayashii]GCE19525.1 hypothetical protein KDK_33250 [Dictyobacter kobayashii]